MSDLIDNKATRGSISQIILTALSDGDKYGYEICKNIESLTNGKLILKQPSLYSSLRRMEEQGLISSYWQDSSLGGRRHYYSMTEKGKTTFESNKEHWKDEDALIASLPENTLEIDRQKISTGKANESSSSNEENISDSPVVGSQANIFNILKSPEPEIKRIDSKNEESGEGNSFLQFDFFEQNIKFVKEDSKKKQKISSFTNRYTNLDNHAQEIESDAVVFPIQKSQNQLKESSSKPEKIKVTELTEISGLEDSISQKKSKNLSNLNSSKNLSKLTNAENDEDPTIQNQPPKNHNLFDDVEDKPIKREIKDDGMPTLQYYHEEEALDLSASQNADLKEEKIVEKISWEKQEPTQEPFAQNSNDYKSTIGKLYNNSQLKDPYEQNKYHAFKEIFPSTKLKETELAHSSHQEPKSEISSLVESSSSSNIDCDDLTMLNSLYNLQGISIKIHSDVENKKQNKMYTDRNKLNMVCAWLVTFILLLETGLCYFILKSNGLFLKSQAIIYFLAVAVSLSYCTILTLENFFDRFKLVIIDKKFTKTFIPRLLIFILVCIAIFAVNIGFGMKALNQVDFLSFWLLPTLLATNLLLKEIIYYLLLKTKYFNN